MARSPTAIDFIMLDVVLRVRRAVGLALMACSCLLFLGGCSQSQSSTQIPAGSTAALGTSAAPDAPQNAMLDSALTKDTRNTLQQAMNSTDSDR